MRSLELKFPPPRQIHINRILMEFALDNIWVTNVIFCLQVASLGSLLYFESQFCRQIILQKSFCLFELLMIVSNIWHSSLNSCCSLFMTAIPIAHLCTSSPYNTHGTEGLSDTIRHYTYISTA